jgi:hypothetical protein
VWNETRRLLTSRMGMGPCLVEPGRCRCHREGLVATGIAGQRRLGWGWVEFFLFGKFVLSSAAVPGTVLHSGGGLSMGPAAGTFHSFPCLS